MDKIIYQPSRKQRTGNEVTKKIIRRRFCLAVATPELTLR